MNPYLIMNAAVIYFHLMFFKSCVFNHDYKAMLLLSEVHNCSQERSAYQHCSRSSMKCHALPLLCRGKTAVTKMIILAFQARICLQKSHLYYSNSSFCLAQNITYLRGSSVVLLTSHGLQDLTLSRLIAAANPELTPRLCLQVVFHKHNNLYHIWWCTCGHEKPF